MDAKRILSIDVFRGLTIFLMVFVNDLMPVTGIPTWLKHASADANTMTFVDVVFPAFLFIVGISIPLSMVVRLARGERSLKIGKHIFFRTAGLIILGLFMVNSWEMEGDPMLISRSWWDLLLYFSAILVWNRYPRAEGARLRLFVGLQVVGMVFLAALALLYPKGEGDIIIGMKISYWGILGLIGWAYLLSVVAFLLFKDNVGALIGMLALFVIMVTGLQSKAFHLPPFLAWFDSQVFHLTHASITLAGIVFTMLFLQKSFTRTHKQRMGGMLITGLFFLAAGFFLAPVGGISKIYATPSWALYSVAICCFLFPIIYWLVDVKSYSRWANFLKPAGTNPLLTYILPYMFYAVFGITYLGGVLNNGLPGILRSVLFSLFILGIAALCTRRKIILRL
ncbi:MAG: DUF5009 domain-containing protein [Bacteroidales bacterium]|nr:DUF5009 domain-containing protein [Bacteroidales bacterium]